MQVQLEKPAPGTDLPRSQVALAQGLPRAEPTCTVFQDGRLYKTVLTAYSYISAKLPHGYIKQKNRVE